MKTKRLLRNEEGFTLIEIIAVLVILGILAAVAVPKYFDLQTKAREKAIYTAVSEIKVRINQHFASRLLQGDTFSQITFNSSDIGLDIGPDFDVPSASWNYTAGVGTLSFVVIYPKGEANATVSNQTISLPKFSASP